MYASCWWNLPTATVGLYIQVNHARYYPIFLNILQFLPLHSGPSQAHKINQYPPFYKVNHHVDPYHHHHHPTKMPPVTKKCPQFSEESTYTYHNRIFIITIIGDSRGFQPRIYFPTNWNHTVNPPLDDSLESAALARKGQRLRQSLRPENLLMAEIRLCHHLGCMYKSL